MTIDEAIKHCEEVAYSKQKQVDDGCWEKDSPTEQSCKECAKEHSQLAEWLKELKQMRKAIEDIKTEIKADYKDIDDVCIKNGLSIALRIIDRHISEKGR